MKGVSPSLEHTNTNGCDKYLFQLCEHNLSFWFRLKRGLFLQYFVNMQSMVRRLEINRDMSINMLFNYWIPYLAFETFTLTTSHYLYDLYLSSCEVVPRNISDLTPKVHFLGFSRMSYLLTSSNMAYKWVVCYYAILDLAIMSSI